MTKRTLRSYECFLNGGIILVVRGAYWVFDGEGISSSEACSSTTNRSFIYQAFCGVAIC